MKELSVILLAAGVLTVQCVAVNDFIPKPANKKYNLKSNTIERCHNNKNHKEKIAVWGTGYEAESTFESLWFDDNGKEAAIAGTYYANITQKHPSEINTGSYNMNRMDTPEFHAEAVARAEAVTRAANYAKIAETAMGGNDFIKRKIDTLRTYAKTRDKEWAMTIDFYRGEYHVYKGDLIEGQDGWIGISRSVATVLTLHTHNASKDEGVIHFTGPSGSDINSVLSNNYVITVNRGGRYRGTVIFAYDGSEYFLYVNNRKKAIDYYIKCHGEFDEIRTRRGDRFVSDEIQEEYKKVYSKLVEDGYSKQEAHDYTMSYLLDKFETGLKLSKRNNKSEKFKQTRTVREYFDSTVIYKTENL